MIGHWKLSMQMPTAMEHLAFTQCHHRVKRKFTSTISQSLKINLEQTNISMKKYSTLSFSVLLISNLPAADWPTWGGDATRNMVSLKPDWILILNLVR